MTTVEAIKSTLAVLSPLELEIHDESAAHAGHAGARAGGGHYCLRIVAPCFSGKGTVARHRLIYDTLGALIKMRHIHALAIIAMSPEESSNT